NPHITSNAFRKFALLMVTVLGTTCAQIAGAAGLLTPNNSDTATPEIRQHHVEVVIENGYAITRIEQVFYNPSPADIEATYAFPVPAKAAVAEFTYWIDDVAVTGEVTTRDRAREIYTAEKAQGRETAITEQNEYKTFDSTVYPVRGQQEVRIRLVYIQPTHVDSGIGRYVYPLEDGGTDAAQTAFWSWQDAVTESFSFRLTLRSGYPIDGLRLPQHPQATITRQSAQEWQVALSSDVTASAEQTAESSPSGAGTTSIAHKLDQDILVYWRLQAGLPGAVDLVSYREPDSSQGTFMLTLTPADDLDILQQGRDWIFVLDFSGSMQGKYASLIEGVTNGLNKLQPGDRFRIFLFNDSAWEVTRGYTPVTAPSVQQYAEQLHRLTPDGSTNLYDGLQLALQSTDADRASAIMLVTDGVANVGTTEKKAFLKLLENRDVRLFTFIMGNNANRPLLEGMVKVSQGFSMDVSNSDDIMGQILLAADKLIRESLRNIQISFDGIKVRDLTPAQPGSLYHGQQLVMLGHYWGKGEGRVTITGAAGSDEISYEADLDFSHAPQLNPELERLWAFASIESLQDKMDYLGHNADTEQAITDLAIEYGLVTDYTSMIVVREELYAQYGLDRNNQARTAREQQAQQARQAAPVQSSRQSVGQSLSGNRAYPSGGGGGAVNGWLILILLPALYFSLRRQHAV
ncbi:MAG: VWA domain-containing protein, partial [Pseudomonadales bacterium]|nr:VWA domain-containing protein [Pseudomonadales bacterium]